MRFREIPFDDVDWQALDLYQDRTYSQRRPWFEFLKSIGAGSPVIALLEDGNREVGCFSGMRASKFGIPVMGSPLPGWNTANMGLNLKPGVPRADALQVLLEFTFRKLRCLYLEVADPNSDFESARKAGYSTTSVHGYISNLKLSEDELFKRMDPACRQCIRKADRMGVVVEEAAPEGFVPEFYSQLSEVFSRQGLRPTYSQDRVQALVDHVHPSGSLLLVRARSPEGQSIATGIFPGFGRLSTFWANGSVQNMRHLRPNQALHWFAMRYWKAHGVACHDWGGSGIYKKNYGGEPHVYVREFRSAVSWLDQLRRPAIRGYRRLRSWRSQLPKDAD